MLNVVIGEFNLFLVCFLFFQPPQAPTRKTFKLVAQTQAEEDAYNYVTERVTEKPTGIVGSVAHLMKGGLGGGILGGHVAWKLGGLWVAVPTTIICGMYIGFCLYSLVVSGQVLCRRTRIPSMTYPDIGEAAFACHRNPNIRKRSKQFRYVIDTMLCTELFGSCAAYQIIIAKSIKQLVENTPKTSIDGIQGYPSLRLYLAIMIIPIIIICLIRHLKYLAPLSIVANFVILFCIIVAVYYAFINNPRFEGMAPYTSLHNFFRFIGMIMFSMSCVGVVIPVENNMKEPAKFGFVLFLGMALIIGCTFLVSFFGYAGYLDRAEAPITVNFPLDGLGKTLKICIAVMIYVTHGLNFWVPFSTVFVYIRPRINPDKLVIMELFYRALFVLIIGVTAIIFPTINSLMGFLGAFCLSNLAFIYPNIIYLLVIWERPGLGKLRWRLWVAILMICVGIFVCIIGSLVTAVDLVKTALGIH
ncbi:proton-coupled amino acid transporter-like protein pathetic [Battus philenor]|uniref:proton-coupled amino acid transporter-like protein pathetic n=1 Tax=Battus philenor TaxID=42288 RepID=UPI0035D0EA8F